MNIQHCNSVIKHQWQSVKSSNVISIVKGIATQS